MYSGAEPQSLRASWLPKYSILSTPAAMRATPRDVCRIFRNIKTHTHMALGTQIVNLVWLDFLYQLAPRISIRKITIMQKKVFTIHVRVLVNMVYAACVKGRGTANYTVHLVPFFKQNFG